MIGLPGSGLVTVLEETTFCISEASGDIVPGAAQGLFFRDTRFVSRLQVARLDGEIRPEPVAVQPNDPFACTFLSRRPPAAFKADSTLLVIRRRYVGNGMRDDITLRNLGRELAAHVTVALESDFADLFEVKEGRTSMRTTWRSGRSLLRSVCAVAGPDRRRGHDDRHRRSDRCPGPADLAGGGAERRVMDRLAADHAVARRPGGGPAVSGGRAGRAVGPGQAAGRLAAPRPAAHYRGRGRERDVRDQHRGSGLAARSGAARPKTSTTR